MQSKFLLGLGNLTILLCWTTLISAGGLSIRTGLNFANASTDLGLSLGSRILPIFGFMTEGKLSQSLFLQQEFLYVAKGASFKWEIPESGKGEVTWSFYELEFPFTLKTKLGLNESKPYLFAGPNLGVIMFAETDEKFKGQIRNQKLEGVETIDFSLDLGGGAEFGVTPNITLLMDIRYSLGLNDIAKSDEGSWKSRGLQLIFGVIQK